MFDNFLFIFGSDSTKKKIENKNYEKKFREEIKVWKSKLVKNDLLMFLLDDINKDKINKALEGYNSSNLTKFDNKTIKYYVYRDHVHMPWQNSNGKYDIYYSEFGYDALPCEAAVTVFAASIMNELNKYDDNKWDVEKLWWSDSGSYGIGKGGNGIVYHSYDSVFRGFCLYRISDIKHKEW